jgi:hypothetical protein
LIENSKQDVTSFFLPPSIFPRVLNLLSKSTLNC